MKKILLSSLIILLAFSSQLKGQVSKFQALYLLNFSKNLNWNQENVVIGVVGKTKTLNELETLASKYSSLSIKKVSASESLNDCQLIFLPSSQSKEFDAIQKKIGNLPVVLVAEDDNLASKGAEIAFYLEGNKLKFYINNSALDASGVKANDKLLSVAKIIN